MRLGHWMSGGRPGRRLIAAIAVVMAAALAGASSAAAEGVVAFNSSPLNVFVGPRGECQSSYSVTGVNYFINENGDCGFFLAFPKDELKKQPLFVQGKTFGFSGAAGPHLTNMYVPVSQSAVTGAGTSGSPFTQTTIFDVAEEEVEGKPKGIIAQVTETTTYVTGAPDFTSTYAVKNEGEKTMYFRGIYAGDLYVAGEDFGIGSFLGGPPRFIGGVNTGVGIIGGFIESTPWSAWEEGCWNETPESRCEGAAAGDPGIWHIVRGSAEKETGPVFNDEADAAHIDNAVGVEFDEYLTKGLAHNEVAAFTIINHTEAPAGLSASPASQTLVQGQTETVNVTALNTAGKPYAGGIVRYTVSGANPQSGAITLNGSGQGAISYVGTNVGVDTIQMFLDLGNTGSRTPTDPSATATVTFTPKPPTPNSTYVVQAIKANPNGTITITFVPAQGGTATVEVTVPTGSISRREAEAARRKKCKKGQIKIKGKCRPAITVSGKVSATGVAGVPLTITVKPSGKVTAALKKGRTVHLTVTLTYQSSLGGAPSVTHYSVTVKPHKKHKHH